MTFIPSNEDGGVRVSPIKSDSAHVLHLDLDGAWQIPGVERRDARSWGPRLRFSAPSREIELFYRTVAGDLPPFLVYGSGDFHHLTALWLRRLTIPVTVISFDNHPDCDIRPPKWCCGSWVNRALELARVRKVSIWGCGNFECWCPGQLFGNRRAERAGKLEVHPWADDRSETERQRRGAILESNWQEKLQSLAAELAGGSLYVTIDLDCLKQAEAVTNWESGRFSVRDLVWALELLKERCRIIAGDICGAWSPSLYARWKQRFASEMDHPKIQLPELDEIQRRNHTTLCKLLPILTEGNKRHTQANKDRTNCQP